MIHTIQSIDAWLAAATPWICFGLAFVVLFLLHELASPVNFVAVWREMDNDLDEFYEWLGRKRPPRSALRWRKWQIFWSVITLPVAIACLLSAFYVALKVWANHSGFLAVLALLVLAALAILPTAFFAIQAFSQTSLDEASREIERKLGLERQTCPRCAYHTNGSVGMPCPECGWTCDAELRQQLEDRNEPVDFHG